jgi:hypothetical protein
LTSGFDITILILRGNKMKTINKIGYGLLSLATLFFSSLSDGFSKNRIVSSLKSKINKIALENGAIAPESLILQQTSASPGEDFAIDASHRSHASHKSHASHSSGTSGRVGSSRSTTTKDTSKSAVSSNPFVQYLTIAEVGMISGLKDIQQTLEPTVIHFILSDGKEILRIKFSGKENINTYKSDSKYSPVSGLGEAALVGTLQLPMQLLFAKGKYCVEIMTFLKEGLNLYLSLDQMKIAANYISSRLTD